MSDTFRERLKRLFTGKPATRATPVVRTEEARSADAYFGLATARPFMSARASEDCPLPDCSTCLPESAPLDVVAEQQRAAEIDYAASWLREQWPDVWYREQPERLRTVAAALVDLDRAVRAGRVPL